MSTSLDNNKKLSSTFAQKKGRIFSCTRQNKNYLTESIKNNLKPLVVILGPTASGKTDLAIKLAKKYHGEIICADSRTIYKGMDIGTAKAIQDKKLNIKNKKYKLKTKKQKNLKPLIIEGVPHYMIDVVRPNQTFTVAQFKNLAIKIIKDIHQRGKIPFLVGGTGLYISTIVDNLEIPHIPPDKKLREKLEKQAKKYGSNYLYKKLLKLDPEIKKFIEKKNIRRVIRALEVCLKTKKTFSQLRQKGKPLFKILQIGIKIPRHVLYRRINQRVDKMIKDGLIDEVRNIYKQLYKKIVITETQNKIETQKNIQRLKKFRDLNIFCDSAVARKIWRLPSMTSIGYRQIGLYLQNKKSLAEAIDLIKKDTRHYAKRQMTWFKRDKRIYWVAPKNSKRIQQLIKYFIG